MRDFDWQVMQLIQNKTEEEIEDIILRLCDQYNLNYENAKRYVEELKAKLK